MNKTFLATLSLAVLTSGSLAHAAHHDEQQAIVQSGTGAAQAVAADDKVPRDAQP